jgi:GT2 family glycosyltransferase
MPERISPQMTASTSNAPVSLVVPTIGRVRLLTQLLESVAAGDPLPGETLIVDQGDDGGLEELPERFPTLNLTVIPSDGRHPGLARNDGWKRASFDTVLGTDDDCIVAPDWVGKAWRHMQEQPNGLVTGRVLPKGDAVGVPSVKEDPRPHDYTGTVRCGVLFPNNMALPRALALSIGGFDPRVRPNASDNDLCYRWLRAGFGLRYEPDMVVWHDDWRSPEQLERLYVDYAIGQGRFYAKHLRQGDLHMLRFIASDVYQAARGAAVGMVRGRPRWSDWRRGIPRGLPAGMMAGWREFGPSSKPSGGT